VPSHDTASRTVPRPAAIRRLAAAGFAALSLAACGTPGPSPMTTFPPTTPPTTTPSASPSPTTAPEPEPEPTTATPTSRADATWEVVEQFFDAYTYGIQTGDSSRLEPLVTESCTSCASIAEAIDEYGRRSVVGSGGEFHFPLSEERLSPYEDRAIWRIEYTQSAIERDLSEPAEHFEQDDVDGEVFVELTLIDSAWRVSELSSASTEADG